MKIMFIPTSYPDETNPVRNIFVYEQAAALAKLGNEICILNIQKQPSHKIFSKIDNRINRVDDGFAIRYVKQTKTFQENKFPIIHRNSFVNGMKELYEYAINDGWKPDILYAHFSCWAGYAAVKIANEHSIPVVTIEHFSGFMTGKVNKTQSNGLRYTIKGSDRMLCVSRKLMDSVRRITKLDNDIIVVPNMVDSRLIYCAPQQQSEFRFCTVSNLNNRKRVEFLVEAFCEAFSAEDNVTLTIGGDGEKRQEIERLIKKNEREKQIILLGRINREETVKLYKESHCFALASAFETFGIVWREAMAVGRPVITTNHGGFSDDDWSDKLGIMVPVDNKEVLVTAFKKIRDEYDKYNGKYISEFCLNRYSEIIIGKRLEKIFEEAIKNKKGI